MKPLAVFTISQNEKLFLPAWLSCYTREVSPEDIWVLDHETIGDAADAMVEACQKAGVEHILPVTHDQSYDSFWLTLTTRYFQQFLLTSYKAVLFCAVDEIVLPLEGTLLDYVASMPMSQGIKATGYEILQDQEKDQPIDWEKPLVAQRSICYQCQRYSKPVISTSPLYWGAGWFAATNVATSQPPDPNLALLHLHKMDYDTCLATHREKSARTWKPEERVEGVFRHNMVEEPDMLKRWMLANADDPANYAQPQPIPERFKEFV